MASLTCTICEQETGVMVNSNAETGDTQIVGAQCLPGWALTNAATFTQGMPAEYGDVYGELFDAVAANDPRPKTDAAPNAAKRSRGKKQPTTSESATGAGDPSGNGSPPPSQPSSEIMVTDNYPIDVTLDPPCPNCGHTMGSGDDTKVTCNKCDTVIATRDEQGV